MTAHAGTRGVTDNTYTTHICISSGIFTPSFTGTVEVLVVAGGGGGGVNMGGGGGGGGVLTSTTYSVTKGTPITVTVGAGGTGAPGGTSTGHPTVLGSNGGNSVFGTLTAIGGGRGGMGYNTRTSASYAMGASGGSGGGATGYNNNGAAAGSYTGGAGTVGQGYAGGNQGVAYYSGGGGGAGGVGTSGNSQPHGGPGILNEILDFPYYWGGGGGGSSFSLSVGGNGGIGGGGGGAVGYTTGGVGYNNGQPGGGGYANTQTNTEGGDGGAHTGGGGGGGAHYNRNNKGGNGGSGIVIIKHLTSLGTSKFTGGISTKPRALISMLDAASTAKGSPIEVLVVGGGGGGGVDMGGGGGAGGVIHETAHYIKIGKSYPIVVGAGGAGAWGYAMYPPPGRSGYQTTFDTLIAYGGGGGGSGHYYPAQYGVGYGQDGASGGGDSPKWGQNRYIGCAKGRPGQGNNGAHAGPVNGRYTAGGGGGAVTKGGGGGDSYGGDGGRGYPCDITGSTLYWGGGGGGATYQKSRAGHGGIGGGGGGSEWNNTVGTGGGSALNSGGNGTNQSTGGAGGANTGGGGGGGAHQRTGGAGGSGIVVIRYYGPQVATGGTVTSVGGYTIHKFTSSGTFTLNSPTGARGSLTTDSTTNKSALTDSISKTTEATKVMGTTWSSSNKGIYTFNGTSDYIVMPKGYSNFRRGITLSCFAKFDSTSGSWVRLFDFGNGSPMNNVLVSRYSNTNYLFWGIYPGTGSVNMYGSSISWNEWAMYTVTADGSNMKIYKNGNLEATYATSTLPDNIVRNNNYIGKSNWVADPYYKGSIALVQVYNKALNAHNIKRIYSAYRGRFGI